MAADPAGGGGEEVLVIRRASVLLAPGGGGGEQGLVLLVEVHNRSPQTFARCLLTARLSDARGEPVAELRLPGGAIAPGEQILSFPAQILLPDPTAPLQAADCRLECTLTRWATTVRHIAPFQRSDIGAASAPPPEDPPGAGAAAASPQGLLGDGGADPVVDIPDEDVVVEPPPPRRPPPWEQPPPPRQQEAPREEPRAEAGRGWEPPWKRAARRDAEATRVRAAREERASELRAQAEAERVARGPDPEDPWAMLDHGDLGAAERLFGVKRLDSAGATRVRRLLSDPDPERAVLGCSISRWSRWSAPTLLRPLLVRAEPEVREAAVAALGLVAGPSMLNDVSPLLADPDARVQEAARLAIARMRGQAPRP